MPASVELADCGFLIGFYRFGPIGNRQSPPSGNPSFVIPEETDSYGKLFSGADLSIPRRSAVHANLYSLLFENNERANLRCEPS
jgi:hypothetical protein